MEFLSSFFSPPPSLASLSFFIGALIFGLTASLLAYALGISLIYPLGAVGFLIACYVSVGFPRAFLFGLIILRMSLDYSSQYISVEIGEDLVVTLSQLIGVAVFFVGMIFVIAHIRTLKGIPLLGSLGILILFGLVNLFYSIDPGETAKELLRIVDMFLLFVISYSAIKHERQYQYLLEAILASSVLPLVVGIYQFFSNIGFEDETVQIPRIYATFSHPNVFSLYLFMVIAVAILYFVLFADTKSKKIATSVLVALYSVVVLLTYTRIAWVALFLFFAVLIWYMKRRLLIPFILIPVLLYLLVPPLQERVNRTLYSSPTDSITWRQTLWQDNIHKTITDDRWVWGYGIDTFPLVSESFRGQALGSNEAHNDYVKFFVEGGLVGLGIYLYYLASIGRVIVKGGSRALLLNQRAVAITLGGIFIAVLAASFSDNVFKNTPLQWIFWVLLGASLSAMLPQKKRV